MIEFRGRLIPETLEDLVDPKTTAVLVIDVQNDFCVEGGTWHKLGKFSTTYKETIQRIRFVLEAARKAGALVIYTQSTHLPNYFSDTAASIRVLMHYYGISDPNKLPLHNIDGSWGQQFVEDIKPQTCDVVIKKTRASAFIGSNLELVLRSNGIRNVIVTGVMTQACVEGTARDAAYRDFFVVILTDCVDSWLQEFHRMSIKLMEHRFDCTTSTEIANVWNRFSTKQRVR